MHCRGRFLNTDLALSNGSYIITPSRKAKLPKVEGLVSVVLTSSKDSTQARGAALLEVVSVVFLPTLIVSSRSHCFLLSSFSSYSQI